MQQQPNNIKAVNLTPSLTTDDTDFFFSNYFTPTFTVSQNVDDAILSFFEKITENKESAKILASSVIYTSLARDLNPMEILSKFSSMGEKELNSYVTAFLNINRIGTSYLGINGVPKVGKYVQRMLRP
jgi:hypothetical protein